MPKLENKGVSLAVPPRLLARPVNQDINFFPENTTLAPPPLVVPGSMPGQEIDPSLIDAIRNPRERMQTLNIEKFILDFVRNRR